MKPRSNSFIDILAAGVLALVMLSLPLFWARWFCQSMHWDIMPMDYRGVTIQPCGLMPPEIENDPNVAYHSQVSSNIINPEELEALGIVDYLKNNTAGGWASDIYHLKYDDNGWHWIYFDKNTGRIVCRYETWEQMPDNSTISKMAQIYIGPEGISESPDQDTGRFSSPIVGFSDIAWGQITWYDKKLRQFFAVKFHNELEFIKGPQLPEDNPYKLTNISKELNFIKGPQLPEDNLHKPVNIGWLDKNPQMLDLSWATPHHKGETEDPRYPGISTPIKRNTEYRQDEYILILDESGQIDLLDRDTLEFAGRAGYLPTPATLFKSNKQARPQDLLAYRVLPVSLKGENKYRGMFAAAVSRDGTALALGVFNEKGDILGIKANSVERGVPRGRTISSTEAMLFGGPWAPLITVTRFILENLQPPVLSVASYFTADCFEAGSGHRALFLLPNSFIAMKARGTGGNIFERFVLALLLMLPSIILSLILARQVSTDAAVVGLSSKARFYWMIGTLAFGLVGYITYRLIRPAIALVTCANCGNPRRPDMEKCHRCGSGWHMPEIIPPAWRVIDG